MFDVHTLKGKLSGKTIQDMIIEEQEALKPKQLSIFDNEEWSIFLNGGN